MSETVAALRAQHALVTEHITTLNRVPTMPADASDQDRNVIPPAHLKDSARQLWEAKLVQIHTAAVLDGDLLYPVDHDGRCTQCGLDLRALQRMQQTTPAHHLP